MTKRKLKEPEQQISPAENAANQLFSRLTYSTDQEDTLLKLVMNYMKPGTSMLESGRAVLQDLFGIDLSDILENNAFMMLSVRMASEFGIAMNFKEVKSREAFLQEFGRCINLMALHSQTASLR